MVEVLGGDGRMQAGIVLCNRVGPQKISKDQETFDCELIAARNNVVTAW